ncbi:threonine/serine ThrE exporter family protein [Aliagarivorans marinus]|uniref:threonine/serine ThrE exporter family protein n=1 Tax=Aliagarivorans marinus TaxID=561965 RepID=UPI00047C801D|nr:threonine/serine exporter family protein [Aliagarivorans marinus]
MSSVNFDIKRRFVIRLGKALHQLGTPAARLESLLTRVARTLHIDGTFLVQPTNLTFVMWEPSDDPEHMPLEMAHIARTQPGDINLGALARVNRLVDRVLSGETSPSQALLKLREIEADNSPYPEWLMALAFCISGGAFAMLISSNWQTTIGSTILSLISYALVHGAARSQRIAKALEPASAMFCAIGAMAMTRFMPELNVSVAVLSAIIIFIPGLSITLALKEVSARELLSGTARLVDAFMVMFKLYFGTVLGMAIGAKLWGKAVFPEETFLSAQLIALAALVLSLSLVVVFKVRVRDALWCVMSGVLAYVSSIAASEVLGDGLGPFVGALLVGLYGNLYARVMKAPASVVLLPGIVLLVPGSKTYISLNSMIMGESIINQPDLGSQTFLIFMSLVAGLVFADVLVEPRNDL